MFMIFKCYFFKRSRLNLSEFSYAIATFSLPKDTKIRQK